MKNLKHKLVIKILIVVALLLISQQVLAQSWRPVRGGISFGISGMSVLSQKDNAIDFLIVHDNKQKNQGRLAIISIPGQESPVYFPIDWPSNTELPLDLEALTSIPGKTNSRFIAFSSAGKGYDLQLNPTNRTVSLIKVFELTKIPPNSNFEGFTLQNIDGKLIAVWTHRGADQDPAIIYWGLFDLVKYQITPIGSAQIKVPFPTHSVRHISDIKVDAAGIVYITSASDTGDDGPFESAVYVAGYLGSSGDKITWKQNPQLFPFHRFKYHKIEALELIPGANGGVVVGTDDENLGGYIYTLGQGN
ncbi:hypothetical protein CLI64_20230 [Nostoc sp. CENA543]|uniref:hypothetical protein n=1 Tax=Nostoc sp. CENA543 TaxID=1869241 RepID=UPI000CA2D180|nr:hypothetical protein [Nostoc sp. CENA543]AUT02530.1 hypothetical protein CLI64_20230 [Nostoc sp. CENA543]